MPKLSDKFKEGIELLNFESDRSKGYNLLLVSDFGKKDFSAKEIFILEAAKIYKADAVYIRRFEDNRSPLAQVYIYDNTSAKLDDSAIAQIHKNLWSSCIIPLFIIINKSKIVFYDSRKPVTFEKDEIISSPFETLDFAAQSIKLYSSILFDNGSFWELNENKERFLSNTSAYQDLIEGLKKIRTKFIKDSELPPPTAHKLLVLCILVKYLEERGTDGESMFAKTFFQKNFGAKDFCEILRKQGKIVELFEKLSEHFNGAVFEWKDRNEIKLIKNTDLSNLADYLDGNSKNSQFVLWRLYSFAHLPVELISSVYEEFLGTENKDVVYTPDFLVNLLVDEALPIDSPISNFRLIDGSCGSGIFLVKAYKRLIEWWRYNKYLEADSKGDLPRPTLRTLKSVLKNSIHGVDIQEDATRLTIFSLALALCDMLTPKQIWTELKFDDLSENIHFENFFKYILQDNNETFDLVIGNPPFDEFTKEEYQTLITKFKIKIDFKIPQNQIALLYLDKAMNLLKPAGKLCLILPSGPLLYNDTIDFRKYFFSKYNIQQILDFTHLSPILFGKANVAVATLFVEKVVPDDKKIAHITVRRTKSSRERIFFEIDHYDFHWVSKEDAVTDKYVWKANLLGGGRIVDLVNRLSKVRTLYEYLTGQKKEKGWEFGQGYIVGKKNKKHKAPHITGHKTVIDKYFTDEGIGKTEVQNETDFKDKSKESIFQAPHILIKKSIGKKTIPIAFSNSYLTFRNEIIGIHAPANNSNLLKSIVEVFKQNNSTYRFYITATSARSAISRSISTLLAEDIYNLPCPMDSKELNLSYSEKILRDDVNNYFIEMLSKGENAKVNRMMDVNNIENGYGTVYCKVLNSIYQEGEKKFRLKKVFSTNAYYGCQFEYNSKDQNAVDIVSVTKSTQLIEELLNRNTGISLRIISVLKIYEQDKFYIIKPKQIRYWLKSIALRDADETFDEILDAK